MRVRVFVLAGVTFAGCAAGCDSLLGIQDHPVSSDSGGPDGTTGGGGMDSAVDSATPTESGQDSTAPEGGSDSGVDATLEAESGGTGGGDAGVDGTNADGSADASACATGCPSQACVGGACVGTCSPGSTQCSTGNAVETCSSTGTWSAPVVCSNSTCAGGACTGSCAAGSSQCQGTAALQPCGSNAMWGAATACTNQACVQSGSTAQCQGVCTPGATQCTSNGVATCSATGAWGAPATCTGQTCVVSGSSASCQGVCAPGQTHPVACGNCGTDTQTCGASGAWVTSGSCPGQGACAQGVMQSCNTYGTQTCSSSCAWGACSCASTPMCTPNATKCSGNGVQTCSACGQWGSAVACASSQSCSGGSCVGITSCQTSGAGRTSCPGGIGSESCCTSPEVTPNGPFNRTYTNSGSGPTGEADPATVSGFRLDKYLVTVGRFRQFVNAWNGGAGYTPPAGSGKHTHLNGGSGLNATGGGYEPGWATSDNSYIAPTDANLACGGSPNYWTWTNTAGSQEDLPINCVSWYDSAAFCIWDGGFLPSEAEWEYAAVGGSQEREYAWGTAPPGTANQYAIYGCYYPSGSGTCSTVGNIAPVGFAASGAGLWGQLDLAGELWEWTQDWYVATYSACTDCANLTAASYRVFRGGPFSSAPAGIVPTYRNAFTPTNRYNYTGFRCARTP
jgi:sulfatase modifying factor 1